MSYTQIKAQVIDQAMQLTNMPKVASGGVNVVQVFFTFCPMWDGYAKSAVFFNKEGGPVYEQVLTDGSCLVPHEVLAESGVLYMGARGVAADGVTTRTSVLVQYRVEDGAPVGDATTVEPSADVYKQLLALAEDTRAIAQGVRADFDAGFIEKVLEGNAGNFVTFWVGTQAQYDALETIEENCFYIITDDNTMAEIEAKAVRAEEAAKNAESYAGEAATLLQDATAVNITSALTLSLSGSSTFTSKTITQKRFVYLPMAGIVFVTCLFTFKGSIKANNYVEVTTSGGYKVKSGTEAVFASSVPGLRCTAYDNMWEIMALEAIDASGVASSCLFSGFYFCDGK